MYGTAGSKGYARAVGLERDLQLITRRRALGWLAGGASLAFGCGGNDDPTPDTGGEPLACSRIPNETAGPFPGDGTNGQNVLDRAAIVRSDIRPSFDGAVGVADGVVLTMTLRILDATTCAPLAGRAVYVWHPDREGRYSMYEAPIEAENYLRGVQVTDAEGRVSFTTIFPGCYEGRWPHVHFEVFDVASPTSGTMAVAISQLALPPAACDDAYATAGYETSAARRAPLTLEGDFVFRDNPELQTATVTGTAAAGTLAAALDVAVAR
jgi:protocatechuate 3,4-dioxygenase beta subunit